MEELLIQFLGLAGVAALIAALVNVGKYVGVIADKSAPKAGLVLSVIGFVALVALKLFAPHVDIAALDGWAAKAADVLMYILGLFAMLGLPAQAHRIFKAAGLPVLGFSHSTS